MGTEEDKQQAAVDKAEVALENFESNGFSKGCYVWYHSDNSRHGPKFVGNKSSSYDPGKSGDIPRKKAWVVYNEHGIKINYWNNWSKWGLDAEAKKTHESKISSLKDDVLRARRKMGK